MNTNKLVSIFSKSLFGVIFITGSLFATEGEEQSDPEHVPVGDRAMTHIERVHTQEERARRAQQLDNGEELSEEDQLVLSENEEEELAAAEGEEIASDEQQEEVNATKLNKKSFNSSIYYTTHEGAFHHPIAVSLLGDAVELEDGSIWTVSSDHTYKTLDWLTGDVIIITPNDSWFSVYDYRLINVNTGASVKVNLSLGPIYNGIFTHWIVAILDRQICLEDGSVWDMSSLSRSEWQKWLPNDTIIIGVNDGWFCNSNPNILINVNVNNYAIGSCLN